MKTPRIDDYEEWDIEDILMEVCEPDTGLLTLGKYDHDVLRDLLSKAHQAGIDEAVNVAHDIFGEIDEFWELMNKFEEALQDNK